MANIRFNQLPVPTFAHLGVNGKTLTLPAYGSASPEIRLPADAALTQVRRSTADTELSCALNQMGAPVHLISGSAETPVRIAVPGQSMQQIAVQPGQGKKLTVIVMYPDSETVSGIEISVPAGGACRLIQVFSGGTPISEVSTEIAEGGEFRLTQIYCGGVKAVSGIRTRLIGAKSEFSAEIGYLLSGNDSLDINLLAEHHGRKSSSQINVRGVLRGSAEKIFRGTIDFQKGASGAKGTEREDVLLLDDAVVNKTAPLILCAEDDVDGTHGATIGRLDPKALHYMQSRGIDEDTVRAIMADARLMSVIRTVGDAETEHEILTRLGRDDLEQSP